MNKFLSILLLFYGFVFSACHFTQPKKIRIGFSQCVGSDKWRQSMLEGMQRELSFYDNVELVYRDADNSSTRQIAQIQELLNSHIDLLIVSPNEAKPLTPVIEQTFNQGMPVIVIDRKISSSLYTAYIGGDNYEIGRRIGEYTANYLHGKGRVLEISGLEGSSPAIERNRGFMDALRPYPAIRATKVYGNWLKEKAKTSLQQLPVDSLAHTDLVFGHNEVMALGAYEYFSSAGITKKTGFIGVDGLPTIGLLYVGNKTLTATALYPTGGEEAIQTAMAILNHRNFEKENLLQTVIIDSSNVRIMKLQANKIQNQQSEIMRQQKMIEDQRKIYDDQNATLLVILVFLVISLALGFTALYFLRENKKINKDLRQKNEEITLKQQQLLEMSAKAEAANEAKLQFFTNISHEFRTPLTLILAPLEDMLKNARHNFTEKQSLKLVQKNVIRLLRLINQLMDFRKIELAKLKLQATENDLIAFTEEIMETFKPVALKRNINFRLVTKEKHLLLWFDVNMLDKVIFNLLSNAFKFTHDNGLIYLYISRAEADNSVTLIVEDNGVGMTPDGVEHAFDLFYNSEITSQQGSGLGLSLSKELITLHQGTIGVESTKWKGTRFAIKLPAGSDHLQEQEKLAAGDRDHKVYNEEKIFITELDNPLPVRELSSIPSVGITKQTILVIEDNHDLRQFLFTKLSLDYEVYTAENGNTGLQLAYENIPDLLICDIVLPDKDGLQITHQLKNDIRTSHIPIVLLTSKSTIDNQIEGMKSMADAYLVKPFNIDFLFQTIRSVLKNRDLLRDHYTSELPLDKTARTPRKLDRKFINDFTAIVENNVGNQHFGADELCKAMGISRVQLYRKVKALLGCNVNDYIISVRLQKAKYYLSQQELTISEVSYKVGFASAAYFSTVFKSKFQMTPKEFREK
jgi:signal transduction histidine kinase/AraC-like DNA-binding protein/CheY-like chemotaxis protein